MRPIRSSDDAMMCHRHVTTDRLCEYPTDAIALSFPAAMHVWIETESDIMSACREVRSLAERLNFNRSAVYQLATAASELASNLVIHAGGGWLSATPMTRRCLTPPRGIELLSKDDGPGIVDLILALTEGYSTTGSLGCGLPGVKRLMDTFAIDSQPGRGTWVRAVKWH